MSNLLVRRKMLTSEGTPVPHGTEYVVTDQRSNTPIRIYETENPTTAMSIEGRVFADEEGFVFFYGTRGCAYSISPVYNPGNLTSTYDVHPGDPYDLKIFLASTDSQNNLLGPSGEPIGSSSTGISESRALELAAQQDTVEIFDYSTLVQISLGV